jgi:hypothetical protein
MRCVSSKQRSIALKHRPLCARRQSEATDSEVLGRLCRMLCVLDKYHQFEYVLLQDSVRYFAAEGAQLVNVYDAARFLALVDRRLQVRPLWSVPSP